MSDTLTELDLDAEMAKLDAELEARANLNEPMVTADEGDDSPDIETEPQDPDTDQEQEETEPDTDPADQDKPKQDQQAKEEPGEKKPDAEPKPGEKLTPYQQRRKEIEERIARAKQAEQTVQIERQEIQRERAEIAREQQAIRAYFQTLQTQVPGMIQLKPGERLKDKAGFSAEDYHRAAKSYTDRGEDEKAELARSAAARLEAQEQTQGSLRAIHQTQQQQFNQHNLAFFEQAKKEIPELAQPAGPQGDPFRQAVRKFVEEKPWVWNSLGGMYLASHLVKARMQLQDQTKLTEDNAALKKRVAELERKLGHVPAAGQAPKTKSAPRRFTDLSLKEQEAELDAEYAALKG